MTTKKKEALLGSERLYDDMLRDRRDRIKMTSELLSTLKDWVHSSTQNNATNADHPSAAKRLAEMSALTKEALRRAQARCSELLQ